MSAAKPAIGIHRDEHGVCGVVFVREPVPCECGRMVSALVNRDGKTRCVECDSTYVQKKEAP